MGTVRTTEAGWLAATTPVPNYQGVGAAFLQSFFVHSRFEVARRPFPTLIWREVRLPNPVAFGPERSGGRCPFALEKLTSLPSGPDPKRLIGHNASIARLHLGLLFSSAAERAVLAAA
jgi:hypothetical protein